MNKSYERFFLIGLIFVFIFVLSSCNFNNRVTNTSSLNGFNGLTMDLRIPRTDFFVSSSSKEFSIPFNLIIKNDGTYTVKKGDAVLQISGYDPSLFTVGKAKIVKAIDQDLEGKSTIRSVGDTYIFSDSDVNLALSSKGINAIQDSYDFVLFYNLCYKYGTKMSSSIKLVPYNTLKMANKVNPQTSVSFSQGQGAPLSIDKIDVFLAGKKVLLTIYVSKRNGKLIYYPTKFVKDECGSIDFSARNKFKVSDASLSGIKGDCVNKFFYLDDNGDGRITCNFDLKSKITQPITSILSLNLEYYVFDSISQSFSIKKI